MTCSYRFVICAAAVVSTAVHCDDDDDDDEELLAMTRLWTSSVTKLSTMPGELRSADTRALDRSSTADDASTSPV